MFLILAQLFQKTMNWKTLRGGTQIALWLLFAMSVQNNKQLHKNISNNIKFRRESRIAMKDMTTGISKNQSSIESIQRNISRIEGSEKEMSDKVDNHTVRLSVLEDRTRKLPTKEMTDANIYP